MKNKSELRVYIVIFGLMLSSVRKGRSISQVNLAEEVGVSQATLSRMERGMVLPDVLIYKKLSEALQLSVGDMDGLVDEAILRTKGAADGIGVQLKDTGDTALRGLATFTVAATVRKWSTTQ